MKTRIKIQGFLIFLAVALLVIFHRILLPEPTNSFSEIIADTIGAILFLAGYFLRITARGYKSELNPDGKTLVTRGPYALCRNPMYLGTLLIGLGIILLILHWQVSFVFLMIYLAVYIPQIKKEERILAEFFQDKFSSYVKNTPRFFPGVKNFSNKNLKIKIKTSWVKKELTSFIAALLFVVAVKAWLFFNK